MLSIYNTSLAVPGRGFLGVSGLSGLGVVQSVGRMGVQLRCVTCGQPGRLPRSGCSGLALCIPVGFWLGNSRA